MSIDKASGFSSMPKTIFIEAGSYWNKRLRKNLTLIEPLKSSPITTQLSVFNEVKSASREIFLDDDLPNKNDSILPRPTDLVIGGKEGAEKKKTLLARSNEELLDQMTINDENPTPITLSEAFLKFLERGGLEKYLRTLGLEENLITKDLEMLRLLMASAPMSNDSTIQTRTDTFYRYLTAKSTHGHPFSSHFGGGKNAAKFIEQNEEAVYSLKALYDRALRTFHEESPLDETLVHPSLETTLRWIKISRTLSSVLSWQDSDASRLNDITRRLQDLLQKLNSAHGENSNQSKQNEDFTQFQTKLVRYFLEETKNQA